MQPTKSTRNISLIHFIRFASPISAISAVLLLSVACTTTYPKKQALTRVLNEQNELLVKLESDRAEPTLARKVQGDRDLNDAEKRLAEAIEAIKESNKAVQDSLNTTPTQENMHEHDRR